MANLGRVLAGANDGALVFAVRGGAPVRFDREWPIDGNRLTIHFTAARPWFDNATELRYYELSVPTPDVVIDGATGQEIPRH